MKLFKNVLLAVLFVLCYSVSDAAMKYDSGGGATTFTGLTDTPANFTGSKGKVPFVNSGETALEFQDAGFVDARFYGVLCDGSTDDTSAINSAITATPAGGRLRLPPGTCIINGTSGGLININKSMVFEGSGNNYTIIKLKTTSSLTASGYMVNLSASNILLRGFQIDGNSAGNATKTYWGVWSTGGGLTDITIRNLIIKSTTATAIQVGYATTTALERIRVESNYINNIGWRGITLNHAKNSNITNNTIISTASHGIDLSFGSTSAYLTDGVLVEGNVVNRAVSPTVILTGQTEGGFLMALNYGVKNVVVDGNLFWDNRNSGDDGIGLGLTATEAPTDVVITNNIVGYAGNFGIDATTRSVVDGNYIYKSGAYGIALASDLGNSYSYATISNNQIIDSMEAGDVGYSAGIAVYALTGTAVFKHTAITGNTVVDTRGTKLTKRGVYLGTTYGTIQDVIISGNALKDVYSSSIYLSSATGFTNVQAYNNMLMDPVKVFAAADTTPSVLGSLIFKTNNSAGTTITAFDNGYTGQTFKLIFGDGVTTIDFTETTLKGNAGANFTGTVDDTLDCTYDGTNWYCMVGNNT